MRTIPIILTAYAFEEFLLRSNASEEKKSRARVAFEKLQEWAKAREADIRALRPYGKNGNCLPMVSDHAIAEKNLFYRN